MLELEAEVVAVFYGTGLACQIERVSAACVEAAITLKALDRPPTAAAVGVVRIGGMSEECQ